MRVYRSDGKVKVDAAIVTGAQPIALSAGTQSASTGTILFASSNGFTFGMSGSSRITASFGGLVVSNAIQSVGSATGSGTNTSRFAADDHVHAGVFSMGVSTGGNTSGDTRVDVGRFVFQGGNNLTLSQITAANGLNTIVFSAGGGGGGGNINAYAVSNTTQSTTGVLSTNSMIFAGAGNVSVGISNGSVVISGAGGGGGGSMTVSAGTSSAALNSIVFSDSNGFSFGLNGSTVTVFATIPSLGAASDVQSVGTANGSGAIGTQFAAIDHTHAGVRWMGVSGGNQTGDTRVSVGNFVFRGSQNITLSQITGANHSNTIVILGPDTAAALTDWIISAGTTSQALSEPSNSLAFIDFGNMSFGLNAANNQITARASAIGALGVSNTGNTAGNTGVSTGINWVIAGSNNITASQSTAVGGPNTIWISGPSVGGAQTGISGIQVSNTTYTSGTVTFQNANGISFGSSGANGVSASYTVPVVSNAIQSVGSATGSGTNTSRFAADDHVHAGVFSMGVTNAGNTAGNTRVDVGRFVLQGGNNITLSQATAANALNTVVISGPNAQTAISGIQVSNTTYTSGTVTFQNANGASFGSSGANGISLSYTVPVVSNAIQSVGSATGSGTNTSRFAADDHVHAGVFSMGVTNSGNTQGNTRVDVGRFVFLGSNGVTLSQDTAAAALNTIRIFGNVVSNAIQSVGSATGSGTNTTRFAADDHVHAGVFSMGVSTGGNTIGDTRVDVGRFVLQGGPNITMSQITAANGLNTVVVSGGAGGAGNTGFISAGANTASLGTVVFSNSNGVSFGVNGQTVTASVAAAGATRKAVTVPAAMSWQTLYPQNINDAIQVFEPFNPLAPMTLTRAQFLMSFTGSTASPGTLSMSLGLYALNGSTASLVSSDSRAITFTSGTTQSQSQYGGQSGIQWRTMSLNNWALSAQDYLLGVWMRSSGNAGVWFQYGMYSPVADPPPLDVAADLSQVWIHARYVTSYSTAMIASFNVTETAFMRYGTNNSLVGWQPGAILFGAL